MLECAIEGDTLLYVGTNNITPDSRPRAVAHHIAEVLFSLLDPALFPVHKQHHILNPNLPPLDRSKASI